MENTKNFEKIKEEYNSLNEKYHLISWEQLEEDFDIERNIEKQALILRAVRRAIVEKISAYMHLFETFMNPSSAPVMVYLMLKNANENDKKAIEIIYKQLAKIEILSIKLDTVYSEKKEAEFIKSAYEEWQPLKKKILDLIEKFDSGFDSSPGSQTKAYFG